ncbi:MAG: TAXI family TRAP transporter solute-binding subunit [Desulfarculaceae bacterium]|nr:TAXI family TRAP transporter solute-binding subunit [Desulfarculaceae bacterium]MCF8046174.1 TAXI family TRAP transporter solute-binding subunit [Desulfarculaceae bacterium]MCF8066121.1 TAXI family TRAP transporter solute-binding subunit [Desulfarculaceae bacterium]MCF8098847.1 TAXI family TRAP transporter solute-binding subunit [Desulfarculaceae bacterium]MCF8124188.1 TAXI family TRAP transporter solute-binding subunit [Desulfarculaceae bacterium]
MTKKFCLIAVAVVLSLCLMAPAAMAGKQFLRMFSGPEGGSWYPLGSAMMGIVEKNLKISSSNGPGGGVGNCKAVNGGRADLGWTYTHTAYNAYNGRGKFTKKNTNLRHLMSLYPGVFQIAVDKSSKIFSVADLANKRIVPGKVGFSGTVIAELVLKAYGMTFDSIKKNGGSVSFVGYSDSAALLKDGHSDVYMAVTSCPQSTIIDLNFRPGIRFLEVDGKHMAKILNMEPGLMATTIPVGAYKGLKAPVPAVGTVTCIVANKDLSDDEAYNIVKTLYANWPALAKVKKAAIEASKPEKALMGARIPVHPGAMRYYKEMGIAK